MRNKFLRATGFLGMLVLSSIPAKSVQRFSMSEDALFICIDSKRVPTTFKGLTWRGQEYEPVPNRRAKGWLEWNVAPDNTPGPSPVYGEKVSLIAYTDYDRSSFFGGLTGQLERGHPKNVCYTTQLLLSGNPECVILYWSNSLGGMAAISKEDYAKRK
jgi:hypothetical protein